jgi:hypothetical protein
VAAPVILIVLRMLQGLALGGEYGGAATYVAEHAPPGQAWCLHRLDPDHRHAGPVPVADGDPGHPHLLGDEAFADWGWRVPFLCRSCCWPSACGSAVDERVAGLQEDEGRGQDLQGAAVRSFGQWKNLKIVLLALFGLVAGQAVVWYTGQFYALFFLTSVLKVDSATANIWWPVSLLIGTPFFVVFGTLSDKIGRKPIILAGCCWPVLTYFPLFKALTEAANPELAKAQATAQITVKADPEDLLVPGQPDRP